MTETAAWRQCLVMAVGLARVGVNQALPVALADADFTAKFLSRVATPTSFDVLFEYLPDILFFVKDRDGRFTRASRGAEATPCRNAPAPSSERVPSRYAAGKRAAGRQSARGGVSLRR